MMAHRHGAMPQAMALFPFRAEIASQAAVPMPGHGPGPESRS